MRGHIQHAIGQGWCHSSQTTSTSSLCWHAALVCKATSEVRMFPGAPCRACAQTVTLLFLAGCQQATWSHSLTWHAEQQLMAAEHCRRTLSVSQPRLQQVWAAEQLVRCIESSCQSVNATAWFVCFTPLHCKGAPYALSTVSTQWPCQPPPHKLARSLLLPTCVPTNR